MGCRPSSNLEKRSVISFTQVRSSPEEDSARVGDEFQVNSDGVNKAMGSSLSTFHQYFFFVACRLVQPLLNPAAASAQPQPYIALAAAGQMSNPPVSTMQVNTTVFVRGIPWEATTQTVENHFKVYGTIETCHVIRHKDASTNKGIAFVKFHDAAAAHRAVGCNNPGVMDQREIYAEYARPRTTSSSSSLSSSSPSFASSGQQIRHHHGNYYYNEYITSSGLTLTPSSAGGHVEQQYGLQAPATSLVTSPNPNPATPQLFLTSPSSSQFCMNPNFVAAGITGSSSTGYYMVNVGTPAGGGPIGYPTSFSINPVMAVASPSPSWIVGSHGSSLPFANSSYHVSATSGGHVLGYPYPGVQVVATDPASWAIPGEIYNFSRQQPLISSATNSWPSHQSYYNVNQPQHHLMGSFVHQSDPGPSESSSSSYNAVGVNSAQSEAGLGWQQSWQMEAQESTTPRDIHRREEEEDHNLMQHGVAELEVGHDAISLDAAPCRSSCHHPSGLGHGERISAVQPAKIMLRGSPESTEDVDIQFNLRMTTTSPRAAENLGHEDSKSISKHEPADQEGSVATDHAVSPRDEPTSKTQGAQLCVETAEDQQVMADHAQDAEWPQLPSCSADLANLSLKKSHPAEASRKLGKRIMK